VFARRLLLSVVALAALFAQARGETLVMVSPPAELDSAVRASLAPWRVKIIVVDMASGTPAELALTQGAGFVVWRDDDELVLWNAGGGIGERRGIPPELDDASAAALALSIKTWMNLGAPPPPEPPIDGGDIGDTVEPMEHTGGEPPGPTGEPGRIDGLPGPRAPLPPPRLRVDAATGVRSNAGDHGRTDMRLGVAAAARVWRIDAGFAFELGPSHPAQGIGGAGDLSMMAFGVSARYPLVLAPSLVAAPGVGVVMERSQFRGVDTMSRAFSDAGMNVGFDAGGVIEWRRGPFLLGLEIGGTVLPSGDLQDRNVKLHTPAHLQARGLARLGLVLR
jgi:hypothetical protein